VAGRYPLSAANTAEHSAAAGGRQLAITFSMMGWGGLLAPVVFIVLKLAGASAQATWRLGFAVGGGLSLLGLAREQFLQQINPLRVEILADSALFGLIKKGDEAEIIIEGPTETSQFAKVSLVDGLVDAASGTFGVRLELPNPDGDIVGGLKCRAVFPIEPPPGVYLGGF